MITHHVVSAATPAAAITLATAASIAAVNQAIAVGGATVGAQWTRLFYTQVRATGIAQVDLAVVMGSATISAVPAAGWDKALDTAVTQDQEIGPTHSAVQGARAFADVAIFLNVHTTHTLGGPWGEILIGGLEFKVREVARTIPAGVDIVIQVIEYHPMLGRQAFDEGIIDAVACRPSLAFLACPQPPAEAAGAETV